MLKRDTRTPGWLLAAGVLVLFFFWSQSFIAIEALLAPKDQAPRFDWLSLTAARFAIVAAICAVYLLHLVLLCTVLGFALWVWLLSRLPATSVGFTIFLNPPMTTTQKLVLAAVFPAAFAFTVTTGEIVGGVVMLVGIGVATLGSAQE